MPLKENNWLKQHTLGDKVVTQQPRENGGFSRRAWRYPVHKSRTRRKICVVRARQWMTSEKEKSRLAAFPAARLQIRGCFRNLLLLHQPRSFARETTITAPSCPDTCIFRLTRTFSMRIVALSLLYAPNLLHCSAGCRQGMSSRWRWLASRGHLR